jgi:transcription termination factor Rho
MTQFGALLRALAEREVEYMELLLSKMGEMKTNAAFLAAMASGKL